MIYLVKSNMRKNDEPALHELFLLHYFLCFEISVTLLAFTKESYSSCIYYRIFTDEAHGHNQ